MARDGTAASRLIAAAMAALSDGAHDFEMLAVAKRAGVSVGLAYYHFGAKAGLLSAVTQCFLNELEQQALFADVPDEGCWATREKKRLERYVHFYYAHPIGSLMLHWPARPEEVMAVEREHEEKVLTASASNFAQAQQQEQITTRLAPALLAVMTLGAVRLGVAEAMRQTPRPDAQNLVDSIWDYIAAACGANTASQQNSPSETVKVQPKRARKAGSTPPTH